MINNLHSLNDQIPEELKLLAREWFTQFRTAKEHDLRLYKGVLQYYSAYAHGWVVFPKEHQPGWTRDAIEHLREGHLRDYESWMIDVVN